MMVCSPECSTLYLYLTGHSLCDIISRLTFTLSTSVLVTTTSNYITSHRSAVLFCELPSTPLLIITVSCNLDCRAEYINS